MGNCGSCMHSINLTFHPTAHQFEQQIFARNNLLIWTEVHCSLPKKYLVIRSNHRCFACGSFSSKNYIADLGL